jgi:hypothetical protein
MAEQLGDDHEVGAAAHQAGRERVAQHVRGDVVVLQAGLADLRSVRATGLVRQRR